MQVQVKIKRETREQGRSILRSVILEMQYLCLTKSRADRVETDDTGIMRSKMCERSLSYISKSSKVEASNGVERNLLACTEATGERGGVLEVKFFWQ